ncbi:hypothetical protein ABW19_dt0206249 [Dactylella cylindrospora]|nr:hypothetical protein ABW19_dt0206249 [Dactylella cylindrospora]
MSSELLANGFSTFRTGGSLLSGSFFFGPFRADLGGALVSSRVGRDCVFGFELDGAEGNRRRLNSSMKDKHSGEEPRRSVKCVAIPDGVDKSGDVAAYDTTCWSSSSGSGSRLERRGTAQEVRSCRFAIVMRCYSSRRAIWAMLELYWRNSSCDCLWMRRGVGRV